MIKDFIYPENIDEHLPFGANFFANPIIKPDGDWRKSLPPFEEQRRFGVEPSTCFIFAQLHIDATIEEAIFGEIDNDYAERFIAQFAGGGRDGGDPLKAADAIYDHGVIPENLMPHTEDIQSWEEYMSWKGVNKEKAIEAGKKDKLKKERKSAVIFTKNTPLDTKYELIEKALPRSPLAVSVLGVTDGDTYAQKPEGVYDTHLVELLYLGKSRKMWVLDTYPPFIKVLPENYNPDFCMARTVRIKQPPIEKLWFWEMFKDLVWFFKNVIMYPFKF